MQALVFDLLVKFLRRGGYRVTYVRNFTDVDDKIIARSQELSISPRQLAAAMIASCQRDFKALHLTAPDHEPRVSTHITEIIAMIATLIERGYAYGARRAMFIFACGGFLTTASCPTARSKNYSALNRTATTRKIPSTLPCGRQIRLQERAGLALGG